jgi:hypothetical protein
MGHAGQQVPRQPLPSARRALALVNIAIVDGPPPLCYLAIMVKILLALLLLSLPASAALFAQSFATRALVPISLGESRGAYGSEWEVSLFIHNLSGVMVRDQLCPGEGVVGIGAPHIVVPPLATVEELPGFRPRASFVCFEDALPSQLSFSLQVREVTGRGAATPVEIPVVLQEDFLTGTAAIAAVPLSSETRVSLRIYDLDRSRGNMFEIRIFDPSGSLLVHEMVAGTQIPPLPEMILLHDLGETYPALADAERVTIHIRSTIDDSPFWTFASATHNETQQFTIFTP